MPFSTRTFVALTLVGGVLAAPIADDLPRRESASRRELTPVEGAQLIARRNVGSSFVVQRPYQVVLFKESKAKDCDVMERGSCDIDINDEHSVDVEEEEVEDEDESEEEEDQEESEDEDEEDDDDSDSDEELSEDEDEFEIEEEEDEDDTAEDDDEEEEDLEEEDEGEGDVEEEAETDEPEEARVNLDPLEIRGGLDGLD